MAGTAWDLLRGGPHHDVLKTDVRTKLQEQCRVSDVIWWAPECCTFSRARGKPVPGATSWPPALRSRRHPYGLPVLQDPRRQVDRRKVEIGNALAALTFADAARAQEQGRGIAVENPTNSFMWELREATDLASRTGMWKVDLCNCMFRGGRRNKRTTILTNVPEIRDSLSGHMCTGTDICDRTKLPHLKWTPKVVAGAITEYPTKGEAGYPVGFCDTVAEAVVRRRNVGKDTVQGSTIAFTEVFSGPRALLSARVTRHLGAALLGSASPSASSAGRAAGPSSL